MSSIIQTKVTDVSVEMETPHFIIEVFANGEKVFAAVMHSEPIIVTKAGKSGKTMVVISSMHRDDEPVILHI